MEKTPEALIHIMKGLRNPQDERYRFESVLEWLEGTEVKKSFETKFGEYYQDYYEDFARQYMIDLILKTMRKDLQDADCLLAVYGLFSEYREIDSLSGRREKFVKDSKKYGMPVSNSALSPESIKTICSRKENTIIEYISNRIVVQMKANENGFLGMADQVHLLYDRIISYPVPYYASEKTEVFRHDRKLFERDIFGGLLKFIDKYGPERLWEQMLSAVREDIGFGEAVMRAMEYCVPNLSCLSEFYEVDGTFRRDLFSRFYSICSGITVNDLVNAEYVFSVRYTYYHIKIMGEVWTVLRYTDGRDFYSLEHVFTRGKYVFYKIEKPAPFFLGLDIISFSVIGYAPETEKEMQEFIQRQGVLEEMEQIQREDDLID